MLEVDVCLKTSLNNLSILCVCEYARMRDQKVIKRKDGVNVCVYASCFPLFRHFLCEWVRVKETIVLEETTKAFISVGNNLTIMFTFNWNEFKELEKRNCKLNKP